MKPPIKTKAAEPANYMGSGARQHFTGKPSYMKKRMSRAVRRSAKADGKEAQP